MSDDVEEVAGLPEAEPDHVTHKIVLTDKTVLQLPVRAFSASAAGTYARCPRQYFFRYVEGIKSPPGIAQVQGLSAHAALAENNTHKRDTGSDLKTSKVIASFQDHLTEKTKEVTKEGWEGKTKDRAASEVIPALTAYMKDEAPDLPPAEAIEQPFRLSFDGLPIIGFVDRSDAKEVTDYKVSSAYSGYAKKGGADKDPQLTIYSIAMRRKHVAFCVLTKDQGDVRRQSAKRTPEDHRIVKEWVLEIAKAVSKGAFPLCPPGSWNCSAKWCGFWSRCRGAKTESQARKGA